MPWYPSAKACPAAIKPTVQCFFPTLYQVLLFDFSSFGEKLFFCLRGYRRAIARSAVQKTAGAQSEDVPLFTHRRTGGEWVEVATLPHHQQTIAAQSREARCKNSRSAERGCSSVHPPPNRRRMGGGSNPAPPLTGYRRAIARSAVQKQPERRVRMFLCSPAAEQAANGWRRQPGLTAGGSSKPRTTANKLSPRRAKLALNVRIGRSCRAHNHHKFSHRILQPHTKRRASHAD